MKLYLNERPSWPASGCAPAHPSGVGLLVAGADQREALIMVPVQTQLTQQKSVQLQVNPVRLQGTNGFAAKAIGAAKSSVTGVDASGVPPRGKPV